MNKKGAEMLKEILEKSTVESKTLLFRLQGENTKFTIVLPMCEEEPVIYYFKGWDDLEDAIPGVKMPKKLLKKDKDLVAENLYNMSLDIYPDLEDLKRMVNKFMMFNAVVKKIDVEDFC